MTDVDLSEFVKLSKPKRPPCAVGVALSTLPKADRGKLEAACASDSGVITTSAIRQWLSSRGHTASIPGVTAHRHGTCTCGND